MLVRWAGGVHEDSWESLAPWRFTADLHRSAAESGFAKASKFSAKLSNDASLPFDGLQRPLARAYGYPSSADTSAVFQMYVGRHKFFL